MKRALFVLVALAGVLLAYRRYAESQPVKVYKSFAEEVLHRHYDAAAGMCDGLTASDLARLGTQEHIGAGPAMFQTLFPSRFKITSEQEQSDGTVKLTAVQTVLFNPVGVESAVRPAMFADMKQVTILKKTGADWKVTSFENEFQRMDSLTSR
jgi:hypothetical protein